MSAKPKMNDKATSENYAKLHYFSENYFNQMYSFCYHSTDFKPKL